MNNLRREPETIEQHFKKGLKKASEEELLEKFKAELKEMTSTTIKEATAVEGSSFCAKQQYYSSKFKLEPDEFVEFRKGIRQAYLEGLAWVCAYYSQGCCSWSWFYPYHYSPFVSDLLPVADFTAGLEPSRPFKPIEQLLSVLPSRSSEALPPFLRPLMSEQSVLGDLFPEQFRIDVEGKKFTWLGEVLIPFIDERRVLSAMQGYEARLTPEEALRNENRQPVLFTRLAYPLGPSAYSPLTIRGTILARNALPAFKSPFTALPPQPNAVQVYTFSLPHPQLHKSLMLLEDTDEPEQSYIERTDKRGFGGERTVNLIRRALGIRGNFGSHSRAAWDEFH